MLVSTKAASARPGACHVHVRYQDLPCARSSASFDDIEVLTVSLATSTKGAIIYQSFTRNAHRKEGRSDLVSPVECTRAVLVLVCFGDPMTWRPSAAGQVVSGRPESAGRLTSCSRERGQGPFYYMQPLRLTRSHLAPARCYGPQLASAYNGVWRVCMSGIKACSRLSVRSTELELCRSYSAQQTVSTGLCTGKGFVKQQAPHDRTHSKRACER